MYHHHQQQGPQPFPSGPRPPPNQQQVRPPTDMMPPVAGFQFPRPTQLPDELESALSIRGSRDMDHRLIEHLGRLKHQNQASAPGMGQHGNYGTNLCDTQPNQQGVDWSSYEPPTKLFASHPPSAAHQGQHQAGHAGTSLPNWNPPGNDSSTPNQRVEGGRGFYTPESAGTILASFGLSNEDLEALSHYPDDQLTPDTLPFILRDLQIHKTGKPKTERSCSPEVPSLLTVTQTEGRVIDYGHASQAKDESGPKETFKKEPLSTERTVKMYPTTSAPKLESSERRQVRLEPAESIKHGDRDYRRRSSEHHTSRSPPPRKFSTSAKPQHQDRDYRQERPKPRASAEKRNEESSLPKQHTSSGSKPHSGSSSSKKLPTPTMVSDFSGLPPKVFPHTCSLCDMQCDQEKDWVEHLETVNHTAACRHLRTKYPDWKPKLPSRTEHGTWTKKRPAGHSASRSASWSPSPPSGKHRMASYRPRGKPYAPHQVSRHQLHKDFDNRYERPPSRGGHHLHRPSSREHWEKREDGSSRPTLKRPHADSTRRVAGSKGDHPIKRPALTKAKTSVKPGTGTAKQSEEGPPVKKKKLVGPGPDCLVYLSDISKDATEQEVINLAGSFGPINNVLLLPCSDEEDEKEHGLQASVCMMKPEDAQTFANSPNLLIRDKVITASLAKKPEEEQSSGADSSAKSEQQKDNGGEGDQISEKDGVVLIEGLPESGWSEEDLRNLAEPFGYPSDVILAKQIGKALLLMPDVETAQEMVKVLSFSPATISEHKLKIKHVKRDISISTPVALYNLLMQPSEGGKNTKTMSWTMLIVVSNLPPTPSSASIVQKIVSRIGTVFKTLAVNNMVICEMATGQLATAAYKHYLKFPCIIQNNPLVFSRKPDPKAAPAKVIPAFLDADKEAPEIKKDASKSAAVNQKESTVPNTEPQVEKIKDVEVKKEEQAEEAVVEKDAAAEENAGEETTDQQTKETVDTDPKPEADGKTETTDQSTADVTMEEVEDNKTSDAPAKENGANVPDGEEAKTAPAPEGEAIKVEETAAKVEVPKAVSAEREAPVKPSKPAAPGQKQTSTERSKDPVKNNNNKEEERRRLERDRKERESRDRDRRERDRIRKEREYEERAKRDRDRDRRGDPRREDPRREEMRREWERRDRERKEWERREGRKRSYGEVDRRSDSSRRSHWREDRYKGSAERSTVDEDEFPFNLSDFVTVDEVGDDDLREVDTNDAPKPEVVTETTETSQESSEPPQEPSQEPEGEVTSMEVSSEAAPKTEEDIAVKDQDVEPMEAVTTEKETTSTVALETEEEKSAAEEEKSAAEEENSAAKEEKSAAEEEKSAAEEEKSAAEEEKSAAEEEKSAAEEEKSAAEEEKSAAEEEKSVADVTDIATLPSSAAPPAETIETEQDAPQDTPNPPQQEMSEVSDTTVKKEEEKEEAAAVKDEAKEEEKQQTDTKSSSPAENKKSENVEKEATESVKSDSSDYTLPPFDPNNAVGMEFLVPMTGFFCKVCTRFFTGTKDTEISHSKTLKHYENLETFLKTRKVLPASTASKDGST